MASARFRRIPEPQKSHSQGIIYVTHVKPSIFAFTAFCVRLRGSSGDDLWKLHGFFIFRFGLILCRICAGLVCTVIFGLKLVRIAGLEPARVAPLPPQSSVSANSTICAQYPNNEAAPDNVRKGIFQRP